MKNLLLIVLFAFVFSSCSKDNEIKEIQAVEPSTGKIETVRKTSALINYYVNGTSGNDANAGTSTATALKTIQAALYKTTNGVGATIYVLAGTYKERLYWPTSGASAAAPITLTNYNGGVVTLDGVNATNNAQNEMLAIPSRSYIRIDHINITNNTRANAKGIYIVGSGTDIQVTYCKISNIGWTTNGSATPTSTDNASPFIIVGSTSNSYSQIYIGSNEIFNCNTGYSEGLTLTGNVENFLVEMNTVHDIKNIGMDMSGNYSWTGAPASVNYARNGNVKNNTVYNCISPIATSAGIYVDGGKWINIEGNTVYGNYAGISAGCENNNYTTEGINIRSNFIYNSIEAGLLIGSNQPNSKVINSTISNNTVFKNYSKGGYGGEISLQNTNNVKFINNIIQSRSNIVTIVLLGYTSTALSFDYNKYYTLSGVATNITFDWGGNNGTSYSTLAAFKTATGLDANSTYGNPGFVSNTLPNPNLHLTNTSACVNAGLPGYALQTGELDIDKAARIVNSRIDIGADESVY
jgi:hypothetical protein